MVVLKKPSVVLFDLWGTAIKTGFTERVLFAYLRENVGTFVHNRYAENVHVRKDIDNIRTLAESDGGPPIAPDNASVDEIEKTVEKYVCAVLDDFNRRENPTFQQFYMHIIFDGIKRGKIVTPLYSDVATQIRRWREMDIRISVASNCQMDMAQKLLQKTDEGDMTLLMDKYVDNTIGDLSRSETYNAVCDCVGASIGDILFITKSEPEALAAEKAGMRVILCLTHNEQYENRSTSVRHLQCIRTFNEITFKKDGSSVRVSGRGSRASTASSSALAASHSTLKNNLAHQSSQAVLFHKSSKKSGGSKASSSAASSSCRPSSSGSTSKRASTGGFCSTRVSSSKGGSTSAASGSRASGASGSGASGSGASGASGSGASGSGASSGASGSSRGGSSASGTSGTSGASGSGASASGSGSSGSGSSGAGSSASGAGSSRGSSSAGSSRASSSSSSKGSLSSSKASSSRAYSSSNPSSATATSGSALKSKKKK